MTASVSATAGTEQLSAFGRGRQSLKESVWYSGHLLTFLATAKDTQGRFALIEMLGRKGNVPPPHIHHREDETFYILEGEMTAGRSQHEPPPRLKPSEATRMRCKGIDRSGAACTVLGYIRRPAATSLNQTVRRETLWVLKAISQISGTPHPTLY